MAGLLLVSSHPASGKSALAAGLARRLQAASVEISEAEAGPIADALAANPGARVIIVATPADSTAEIAGFVRSAGPVAGVIVNRVQPRRVDAVRAEYEAAGVRPLVVIPEDGVLAAPTLGQLAAALEADSENLAGNEGRVLDRPVIASIAADPGQTYFTRTAAEAVIVRSDKPDLQLGALNASATSCLIMTGGLPVLSYVLDRVRDNEVPLLRTKLDTRQTVEVLESLFGTAPFAGDEKTRRMAELLGDLDIDALLERAAGTA